MVQAIAAQSTNKANTAPGSRNINESNSGSRPKGDQAATNGPSMREHYCHANSVRPTSSIRADIIFGRTAADVTLQSPPHTTSKRWLKPGDSATIRVRIHEAGYQNGNRFLCIAGRFNSSHSHARLWPPLPEACPSACGSSEADCAGTELYTKTFAAEEGNGGIALASITLAAD